MDKLIVDKEVVDELRFDLLKEYPVEEVIKALTERFKQTSAQYIAFRCDTNDAHDANFGFITLYVGREETNDEYVARLFLEQREMNALFAKKERDEYIKYLAIKAKYG